MVSMLYNLHFILHQVLMCKDVLESCISQIGSKPQHLHIGHSFGSNLVCVFMSMRPVAVDLVHLLLLLHPSYSSHTHSGMLAMTTIYIISTNFQLTHTHTYMSVADPEGGGGGGGCNPPFQTRNE